MKIFETILDLLFPPKCPFCQRVLDSVGICAACERELPRTEESETLRTGPDGLRCAAPLWYEDAVRDGLLRFKFHGVSAAARPLGELVARCVAEQFAGEFDTVTWVPVSRKRLKQRGYDQSELLARSACRLWETKPERLLKKIADNPPQSDIRDAAARRANVLGVYESVDKAAVQGKCVLLIDDICTTGATLTECVRELKEAGAKDVVCAVVAFGGKSQKSAKK